jgi:hypothetical protein
MFDRRKVWRSLPDYPVYAPPFRYEQAKIPLREQIEQNYQYFLQHKADRLKYLADYLASFSVVLTLEPATLPVLGRWLYRYGGHLHPGGGGVVFVLGHYNPLWTGVYHGLNVMNDLAIFAGDYIVSRNKKTRWDAWFGDGTRHTFEMAGFGQPCIFGLTHPGGYVGYDGHSSMLDQISNCCGAGRQRWKQGVIPVEPWDEPGEFERRFSYLADADAPPPVPFSQRMLKS